MFRKIFTIAAFSILTSMLTSYVMIMSFSNSRNNFPREFSQVSLTDFSQNHAPSIRRSNFFSISTDQFH